MGHDNTNCAGDWKMKRGSTNENITIDPHDGNDITGTCKSCDGQDRDISGKCDGTEMSFDRDAAEGTIKYKKGKITVAGGVATLSGKWEKVESDAVEATDPIAESDDWTGEKTT